MTVQEAIETRRAYRSLTKGRIGQLVIQQLAKAAQLCCSAENRQPWRFVFVIDPGRLEQLAATLIPDNAWAANASMMVAVCTAPGLDDSVDDGDIARLKPGVKLRRRGNKRPYAYFDTGLATAFLILRATELGLVAHPIAGYVEQDVQAILAIPPDLVVMALIVVGRRSATIDPSLPPAMKRDERTRPARLPLSKIAFTNQFKGPLARASQRAIVTKR